MTKQTKEEKALLQQQKANVYRDRKRRLFYVDSKNDKYYRLSPQDEGFLYLYDSKILLAMLPITISVLVNFNLLFVFAISFILYVGVEVYYLYKRKDLNEASVLPESVMEQMMSQQVLKARRTDLFLKFSMVILIIMLMVSEVIENKIALNAFNTTTAGIYLILAFTLYIAVDLWRSYYRNQKLIKQIKE